jgi:hypothetical protein
MATLSIFRNAHCTLKTLPKIITNSEHHPLFFPLFYYYFPFAKVPISIFGNTHWTLKTLPNIVTTVSTTTELTNAPYSPAQCMRVVATGAKKTTSFLLELGPLTPLPTRKIYPYHFSFTKYILRPCQHKNIFLRCDSDISGSTHQKYILTAFH